MTSDRWQQVERLYHAALAREVDQAGAFLKEACAGDDALRHEVESLLAQANGAGFLEAPALEVAAQQLNPDRGQYIIGRRIGSYQILSLLGEGGMGEVYRAHDTKLKRDVALKILPEAFAHDPGRMARFRHEAEVVASLNHSNIAQIYGVEDRALVMELVEGESPQGPMRFDDAWKIAMQIADALEYAHEKGVVHRDLKPENVKVTPDGVVKLLDFGLARALTGQREASPAVDSPAANIGATEVGVILGTAAYMAPEQAKGEKVNKRADIWSWGVVLYELLTGERLFKGVDVADTLAQVLTKEPDLERVPPQVRKLLGRCLEKDPKQRLRDIGDARSLLEEVEVGPTIFPPVQRSAPARRERLVWIAFASAVLVAAVLAVPAVRYLRETLPTTPPEIRSEINTPLTTDPISLAISPDGKNLVFAASGNGQPRLWLRQLDAVVARPLAGTEGARLPFWSPDSRSVGFFAEGKLKRIDIGGAQPQTLSDAAPGQGGTWSADNVILFAPTISSPILRVPASGGEAVALTVSARHNQYGYRLPQFLPDGRQFLYYVSGTEETGWIYLGSLDSSETKRLTAADSAGAYMPPGWLLFIRQGTLVARRFDLTRRELQGDPVTVADSVGLDSQANIGAFSVSATGLVTYRTGAASRSQLTWFDRMGKMLGTFGAVDENNLQSPQLSPDGRRVAVRRTVQNNQDIYLLDSVGPTRFTFNASGEQYEAWSPDGSWLAYGSNRKGVYDLYRKPSSGGSEELLLESSQGKNLDDWSPDGRSILYNSEGPKSGRDLWVLPLKEDGKPGKPVEFLKTNFQEHRGQFSPDGHWVAYVSDQSGQPDIWVRPFPGPGGEWQVSVGGGIQPRWRHDGRELYYIAPDGRLMAVPITIKGTVFERGTPVPLFQSRIAFGGTNAYTRAQYDVSADGRFLINITTEDAATSPITLLQSWKPPAK